MWSMYDAPSDRDYYEQFNPPEPEDEDPENEYEPTAGPVLESISVRTVIDDDTPF